VRLEALQDQTLLVSAAVGVVVDSAKRGASAAAAMSDIDDWL
jgi:hypothetical protein